MAYETGTANDIAGVLAAITAACTANGWTLDSDLLSRNGCFVSLNVSGAKIYAQGATGGTSGALTNPGPTCAFNGYGNMQGYPATYHIHILTDPDEVYVWVNSGVNFWNWLCFGQSTLPVPGSGNWYGADCYGTSGSSPSMQNNGGGSGSGGPCALFWPGSQHKTGFVHHGITSISANGWTGIRDNDGNARSAVERMGGRLPNSWNGETVLLPIQPWVPYPSSKVGIIAQLDHARYCRNDNYEDGDLITLGSDQWKVYPWCRKDAAHPGGYSGNYNYSGTFAIAIRYDGPRP